uniref:Uncharacterized protein n=1 Tax=Sphaerodactylus townsendi TaxID=933632 RepID=A0ACB8EBC5_9SAUR
MEFALVPPPLWFQKHFISSLKMFYMKLLLQRCFSLKCFQNIFPCCVVKYAMFYFSYSVVPLWTLTAQLISCSLRSEENIFVSKTFLLQKQNTALPPSFLLIFAQFSCLAAPSRSFCSELISPKAKCKHHFLMNPLFPKSLCCLNFPPCFVFGHQQNNKATA